MLVRLFLKACIVVWLLWAGSTIRDLARSQVAWNWTPVVGTVTHVGVTAQVQTGVEGVGRMVHATQVYQQMYLPQLEYEYEIMDRVYRSHRYGFAQTLTRPLESKFSVGDGVTIRYNPSAPQQSVIQPGLEFSWVIQKALLLLGFAFGIWWMLSRRHYHFV